VVVQLSSACPFLPAASFMAPQVNKRDAYVFPS
jgi:hypothetical protein